MAENLIKEGLGTWIDELTKQVKAKHPSLIGTKTWRALRKEKVMTIVRETGYYSKLASLRDSLLEFYNEADFPMGYLGT